MLLKLCNSQVFCRNYVGYIISYMLLSACSSLAGLIILLAPECNQFSPVLRSLGHLRATVDLDGGGPFLLIPLQILLQK